MNTSTHRSQSAVRDPEWYTRNSTRLKPGSPCTETTVIDDMASLGGSLTSLNLDSINFDFENLGHYSTRSMPAILANDAPWNESPRSLRTHTTPSSARRIAAMSIPPPGVSPLDHLQNSISSLNTGGRCPPVGHVITEEDYNDMTDLNESIASLEIEHLMPSPNLVDMDATAHAGNVTRNRTSSNRPIFTTAPPTSYSYTYGSRSTAAFQVNAASADDEDNDEAEIIKLLRDQVQTLKSQLASEQSKNLRNSTNKNNSSFHSIQSSTTNSSFGKDDDDESAFAFPTGNSSTETTPVSNSYKMYNDLFRESLQSIQIAVHLLEKPLMDDYDNKLVLNDLHSNVIKLDQQNEKLLKEHESLLNDKAIMAQKVDEQAKLIKELENKLKKHTS